MTEKISRILVTGALGQIGSELTEELRNIYGSDNVVASDIRSAEDNKVINGGPWTTLDVTDPEAVEQTVINMKIDSIFHMAAILSATGENYPHLCWKVNMDGTLNILEAARKNDLYRIIIPSSIAAFGPETPRENTPQETILKPKTMYIMGSIVSSFTKQVYLPSSTAL